MTFVQREEERSHADPFFDGEMCPYVDPLERGEYSPDLLWPGWIPERSRLDALDDLACFEGYADDARGLCWSAATAPSRLPDTGCRVPQGVDAGRALHKELRRPAVERFDECMEQGRTRAAENCDNGMLPDGRNPLDVAMNDCMAMWVDGFGDHTTGAAVTKGRAHSFGGGFEAGPEWLKFNGGYEYQRSTEHSSSRETTIPGYEGFRRRCMRQFDDDGWMP